MGATPGRGGAGVEGQRVLVRGPGGSSCPRPPVRLSTAGTMVRVSPLTGDRVLGTPPGPPPMSQIAAVRGRRSVHTPFPRLVTPYDGIGPRRYVNSPSMARPREGRADGGACCDPVSVITGCINTVLEWPAIAYGQSHPPVRTSLRSSGAVRFEPWPVAPPPLPMVRNHRPGGGTGSGACDGSRVQPNIGRGIVPVIYGGLIIGYPPTAPVHRNKLPYAYERLAFVRPADRTKSLSLARRPTRSSACVVVFGIAYGNHHSIMRASWSLVHK